MPRLPPPYYGPAKPETIAQHVRLGKRMLDQAQACYPELDRIDAFVKHQKTGGDLDASTVGRYRADLRYALLSEYEEMGDGLAFECVWSKVNAALTERKAVIAEKDRRTSAKKVEDATEAEVRSLFTELKRHALATGNMNAVLAALFTLVAGHSGFRPIELHGAVIRGTHLFLPNAKRRHNQEPHRGQDISYLPKDVITGMKLMLELIDHDLSRAEFAKWQKVLAEQMRRACKRAGLTRVLSLYSFRHISIASWSAAGLSVEDIAALCGHLSVRTAGQHYARAKVGHKRTSTVRPLSSIETAIEITDTGVAAPAIPAEFEAPGLAGFTIDNMPKPRRRKADLHSALPAEVVAAYFAKLSNGRSPDEIAANIRRAQQHWQDREDIDPEPASGDSQV